MKLLIALRPNRFDYFRSMVFSGAMTYAFYWMYSKIGLAMELPGVVLGFFLVCVGCSALFTVLYGYLFATAAPVLAVFEDGIQVSENGFPAERISWQEIKRIDYPEAGSPELRVYLADPNRYLGRHASWISRLLGFVSRKTDADAGAPTLRVSLVGYQNQIAEIKNHISSKWPQQKKD